MAAKPTKRKVKPRKRVSRGERVIAHLRQHRGDVNVTTDEIMWLTRDIKPAHGQE